jgi:multiple sugar transport system substrate-binding protein
MGVGLRHARIARACIATVLLATLMGNVTGRAAPARSPIVLTFWSWIPHLQHEVDLFNRSHPDVQVKLVDAGKGGTEYVKLRTAMKAGSGAPDAVEIEFQELQTFELLNSLVDIAPYGANAVKNDFVPWTWAQVSQGSKVYAIPQDSGPMALLYRSDIFKQYHLAVPTTWAQYAQEALTLHKANPRIYMTASYLTDGGWTNGLLWQAGSRPFKVNGSTISINFTDANTLKVVNYWGDLLKAGGASTTPEFTSDWYTALANGTLATWPTAAWGSVFLTSAAPKTSGQWRVAPLPQWTAGGHASGNWGGSTDAVTVQSKHPRKAAEFAIWLNHDKESATMMATDQFLFPTLRSVLADPRVNGPRPFYGGQAVDTIFAQSSQDVDLGFQWSPFQDYVYTQMSEDLAAAQSGSMSYNQAMSALQETLISYAKAQGFTVK